MSRMAERDLELEQLDDCEWDEYVRRLTAAKEAEQLRNDPEFERWLNRLNERSDDEIPSQGISRLRDRPER